MGTSDEPVQILFGRTVDKIPHLVNDWKAHRMRYEWQALGQFVKDWNSLPHYRNCMLSKPIRGAVGNPKLAYIAATVHALCLRDEWPVPNWVHKFVADDLFIGRFTREQWESNAPDIIALKKHLHPVGQAHNVVLEQF